MEETDLIKKVQKGDLKAFEELFEQYKHSAFKTVYLMTGDRDRSEDILQEAFVICYTTIKDLRSPEYFKTWFYKILTRATWNYMKKEKRLVPTEDIISLVEDSSRGKWESNAQQEDMEACMNQAISQLEPKLQTVVILYYYNGFSVKDIARIMGCIEGTVKSRLYTARRKLKSVLLDTENKISGEVWNYETR